LYLPLTWGFSAIKRNATKEEGTEKKKTKASTRESNNGNYVVEKKGTAVSV